MTTRHPHGLLGHIVDDDDRTRRALRLLLWGMPALLLLLATGIGGLALLAVISPTAGLVGAGAAAVTGTGTAVVVRRGRRRRR
jgi:hypothetical protein